MKMVLDDAAGLNLISAYEPGTVTIRGRHYTPSLVVYPHDLDTEWPVADISALDGRSLRQIAAKKIEVLIIGTGERQAFPEPRVFVPLMDAGIGYEIMDNTAACRTFNILLSEGRQAALALMRGDQA
jgi:uncharacterized protein